MKSIYSSSTVLGFILKRGNTEVKLNFPHIFRIVSSKTSGCLFHRKINVCIFDLLTRQQCFSYSKHLMQASNQRVYLFVLYFTLNIYQDVLVDLIAPRILRSRSNRIVTLCFSFFLLFAAKYDGRIWLDIIDSFCIDLAGCMLGLASRRPRGMGLILGLGRREGSSKSQLELVEVARDKPSHVAATRFAAIS